MSYYQPIMPTTPMFAKYHEFCRLSHEMFETGNLRGADAAATEAQEEADRLQAKLPPALRAVFNRCRTARMFRLLGK